MPFSAVSLLVALLGGLCLFFASGWPAYAAVEISAFDVLVLPSGVVLEWQTASEYDLIGFEVWYKEEEQSQSAYQLLGKRIAQGAPQHGVTYRMDVTDALKKDRAYCFQLRELPINGERGEILNRCGYGLGISAQPTPTPTDLFTATPTITPTLMATLTTPLTGTVDPFSSSIPPTATLSTTDTFSIPSDQGGDGASIALPTSDPFNQSPLPTPAPDSQSTSPLSTPTSSVTITGSVTMSTQSTDMTTDTTAISASAAFLSQTANLTTTGGPGVTEFDSPLPTPTLQPPAAEGVANPPYLVLTATPTTEATTPAPTFTPYPTSAPQAAVNLLGMRVPDTQNLMIMLLCGVFSGASGLGILGLISTLLYMRSRAAAQQTRSTQRRF